MRRSAAPPDSGHCCNIRNSVPINSGINGSRGVNERYSTRFLRYDNGNRCCGSPPRQNHAGSRRPTWSTASVPPAGVITPPPPAEPWANGWNPLLARLSREPLVPDRDFGPAQSGQLRAQPGAGRPHRQYRRHARADESAIGGDFRRALTTRPHHHGLEHPMHAGRDAATAESVSRRGCGSDRLSRACRHRRARDPHGHLGLHRKTLLDGGQASAVRKTAT